MSTSSALSSRSQILVLGENKNANKSTTMLLAEDNSESYVRYYELEKNAKDYHKNQIPRQTVKTNAVARLMKDLKEIHDNPLPTIYAEPLENNIFEWHANLIGTKGTDYEGACFHLILQFPYNYPNEPPKVPLMTRVPRSHVFSTWICLDILKSWSGFSHQYSGWTTAYSCLSVLLQLQSFLFEPEDTSFDAVRNAVTQAAQYKCQGCVHDMRLNLPWPCHEGMEKPLNLQQVIDKYASKETYKMAHDIEAEQLKDINKRNMQRFYEEHEKKRKSQKDLDKAIQEQVQKNLLRLQRRMQNEQRKLEKDASQQKTTNELLVNPNREIPGLAAKQLQQHKKNAKRALKKQEAAKQQEQGLAATVATAYKKQGVATAAPVQQEAALELTEADKNFLILWNTTLDPLAKPFVYKPRTNNFSLFSNASEQHVQQEQQNNQALLLKPLSNNAGHLPWEILNHIFDYIGSQADLDRSKQVCTQWKAVAEANVRLERRMLCCYYSKRTFEEDIIGIGVSLRYHKRNTNQVEYIGTEMDLLCKTAFYEMGIRKTVWNDNFSHFVPIYINKEHGKRAMDLLEKSVRAILSIPKFSPFACLELYAKLCNTMVVSIMNDSKHASIKGLQGYCFFYRMMIAIVEKYPHLQAWINEKVKKFIINEDARRKDQVASMGEFLPMVALSNYTWKHLATPVLKEIFTRNVLWVAKQYEECATVSPNYNVKTEEARAQKSFKMNEVSLKLMMFHVYFLNNVARPEPSLKTIQQVAQFYDMRFGLPTQHMQDQLQKAIFSIQELKDYDGFFKFAQLPVPSKRLLHEILRSSVTASLEKRYHRPYSFKPKEKHEDVKKKKQAPRMGSDEYDRFY